MAERELRLRWSALCRDCGRALSAGSTAIWDSDAKHARCSGGCAPTAADADAEAAPAAPATLLGDRGEAGRSAWREYERRSERERERKEAVVAEDQAWRAKVKQDRPVLGRIQAALTARPVVGPESQATRAWAVGAVGEQRVGALLESWPDVIAIHDRRIPGSKANIDHIAVAADGVYVIDPKRYAGEVRRRDVGSFFRPDQRLYVGSRDRSRLVDSVIKQMGEVRNVLSDHPDVPIFGALCFVGADWRLFSRPFAIGGVWVGWPKALRTFVSATGSLTSDARQSIASRIISSLRAA